MNCSVQVAYSNTWTSSIGSLASPVTIFTPSANGLYRFTFGGAVTFAAQTGTGIGAQLNVQDASSLFGNNVGFSCPNNPASATTITGATEFVVYLLSGDAISVYTTQHGTISSVEYTVVIEQF